MASVLPFSNSEQVAMAMWGLKDRDYRFEFKTIGIDAASRVRRVGALQEKGAQKLAELEERGGMRVLLTGGTGFLGQEIITQVAGDSAIEEVAVVIRPKVIRDRKTREIVETLSPSQRGHKLLDDLGITSEDERSRFRFIAGDIEKPLFGIEEAQVEVL